MSGRQETTDGRNSMVVVSFGRDGNRVERRQNTQCQKKYGFEAPVRKMNGNVLLLNRI